MAHATPVEGLSARSRAGKAARRYLRARLADLLREAPRLRGHGLPDQDAVHDLRVAARRLRVALAFFEAAPEAVLRKLGALKRRAGAVRDLQLQLARVQAGARRGAGRALARKLAPRLSKALALLVPELHAALGQLDGSLRHTLARHAERAAPEGRLGGRRLRKRLACRLLRTNALLREARLLEPAPAHALRRGLKRLRDEAELLAPAFPQALSTLAQLIAPLQESLGLLHDLDVHLALLAEAGLSRAAGEARRERAALEKPLRVQLAAWSRADRLATLATALRQRR
jgi:CHAD domain-containing protein